MKRLLVPICCGKICKRNTRTDPVHTRIVYKAILEGLVNKDLFKNQTNEYIRGIAKFIHENGCVVHHINYKRSDNNLSNLAIVLSDTHDDIHSRYEFFNHLNKSRIFSYRYEQCSKIADSALREEMLYDLECDVLSSMGRNLKTLQDLQESVSTGKINNVHDMYALLSKYINRGWVIQDPVG